MRALEHLWARFGSDLTFDRYCIMEGKALREFAVFCVLAEHYGRNWHTWPRDYSRPDSPAVAQFAVAHANRVRFHQWCSGYLMSNWPSCHGACAHARFTHRNRSRWGRRLGLARRVSDQRDGGVPPDKYNTKGQNWGCRPSCPISFVLPDTNRFARLSERICAMPEGYV
jgi:4-alpha-glucanotransferase